MACLLLTLPVFAAEFCKTQNALYRPSDAKISDPYDYTLKINLKEQDENTLARPIHELVFEVTEVKHETLVTRITLGYGYGCDTPGRPICYISTGEGGPRIDVFGLDEKFVPMPIDSLKAAHAVVLPNMWEVLAEMEKNNSFGPWAEFHSEQKFLPLKGIWVVDDCKEAL